LPFTGVVTNCMGLQVLVHQDFWLSQSKGETPCSVWPESKKKKAAYGWIMDMCR
jgi:hypothetical protein